MARVRYTQTLEQPSGSVLTVKTAAPWEVRLRGTGTPVTFYTAETAGTSLTGAAANLTTRNGRIEPLSTPGGELWLDSGTSYDEYTTVDGGPVSAANPLVKVGAGGALSPSVESRVADREAIVTVVRASGGDDLTAINAALVIGSVILPDPSYLISGEVVVPNTHDLNGAGMEKTVIRATAAGAKITINDRGGKSGNFFFDGDGVATNGVVFQCTERTLESIRAVDCLGDIFQVGTLTASAQNNKFVNVKGHNSGGDVWSLDGGAANNDFFGCYGERAAGYVIHSKRSGAPPIGTQPTLNRFFGGIFERPATAAVTPTGGGSPTISAADGLGVACCTAGADSPSFYGTHLSISGVTTADLPMVYANLSDSGANTARIQLVGVPELDGNAGTSTGLKVANGGQIHVSGRPILRNCLYGIDFDDTSTVYPDRTDMSSGITNKYRARGTKTADSQVRDVLANPHEIRRPATTDTVLAARLDGDSGWRFLIKADGRILKGAGTSFTESTLAEVPVSASFGHPEGFFALSSPAFFGSTVALVSGTWYGVRFTPPINMTLIGIGFRVSTASGTDDPIEGTVHDTSGARLATSGSTTGKLNSTGLKSVTLSQALIAGTSYYIGLVATSTATLAAFALNNSLGGRFFGDSLGQIDAISIAAWGIGNAASLTGQAAAGTVPGATALK